VTWTQLGTIVTVAGTTSIGDSAAELEIGSAIDGTNQMFHGKVYFAEVRNGIDGTAVAKFDPALFVSPLTAQMRTGETWTIHQSGVDPAQINPQVKPVKVIRAWHDDVEIFPQTTQELSLRYAQWTTEEGTPRWFTQRTPESLILVPKPTAASVAGLDIELAVKPARFATVIDRELYEKYLEEISYGAKFKLFAMKSKPWSDPALAAGWRAAFDEACGTARVTAAKGFTRARQRVKAHFF
jgi:hypothetical protein